MPSKLPKRFSVGERVFAKVRGYPPWPAKIENVTDPNSKQAKYHVHFYGTKEIGTCKIEDLFQYEENKEKFTKAVRRKFFQEGLQEIEEDIRRNPYPPSATRDSEAAENVPDNASEANDSTAYNDSSMGMDADHENDNLIIDEGDKKKSLKRKSQVLNTPDAPDLKKKRGRKSGIIALAESTPKQEIINDSLIEDNDNKAVSRSGRKIKPKRFHDGEEIILDTSRNEQTVKGKIKSKTDDISEMQDTPIPPLKKRLSVEKDGLTPNKAAEITAEKQNKINDICNRTLKIESQLIFLDTKIRSSLGLDEAHTEDCLEAMDQMYELEITPLMLKKHAQVVESIKRLRRYVGNLGKWELTEEETADFKEKAEKIQKKADIIYNKFKSLFTIPEDMTFWQYFSALHKQLRECTKDLTPDQYFATLIDPTENMELPKSTNDVKDEKVTKEENNVSLTSKNNTSTDSSLDQCETKETEVADEAEKAEKMETAETAETGETK
ncbi:PC4 and SFRS1-interacting protein isoform X1 [Trichogramma pretiosum]|uniref:PC4 and SFRS1-interacting protein isoform X1 n=1 Tax=Trichogramma pretiosum TaxID=7493 RepID=UPI0006C9BD1F|nr:PC4 and SFRS1-interacting protein isoform X1 [Trichogramma pretiosum]